MATESRLERRLNRRKKEIAERFQEALDKRGLNQSEFAKLADIRVSFVNRALQADGNLTLQTICKFEEILGYDLITIPKGFNDAELGTSGSGSGISAAKIK